MWESAATLSKHSRVTERHIFKCLDRLRDLNVIEDPHEAEWPPEARLYKSVVRRLRPVEEWGGDVTHLGDVNRTGVSPRTDNPEAITSYISSKTSSYYAQPEAARPERVRKDRPRRGSRKPVEEERGFVLGQDPQEGPQEPVSRPNEADPDLGDPEPLTEPQRRVRDNRPGQDSAAGLALHFRDATMGIGWGLEPANVKALSKHFAEWKRGGVAAEDIRAMIQHYADVPGVRTPGKPPWVDFLAKRAALANILKLGQGAAEMESIRFDPDAWA